MELSSHAATEPLVEAVRAALEHHGVRNEKVVVAVSGGPDSVALLQVLTQLQAPLALVLHVAHLNHMLRADRGADDAAFVEELSKRLGLPYTIDSRDIRAHQKQRRNSSLEDAARDLRYRFLADVADAVNAVHIALGHTADDQAETVLLHLVRGTGLSGLRGMLPVRGRIIRPLLGVRRKEIEAFLAAKRIAYRIDETNLDRTFARNRMRTDVLPLLQRDFNPRTVENISRTAHLVRLAEEWADFELDKVFDRLILGRIESCITLSIEPLTRLPELLRQLAVRRAIRELFPERPELSLAHITSIEDLMTEGVTKGQASLPGEILVQRTGDRLEISTRKEKRAATAWELPIEVPGTYSIPDSDVLLRCEIVPRTGEASESPATQSHEAFMDWERVTGDLVVRNRRAGDRFHPLGAPGSRKLKDFFIDGKVPQPERDEIGLLADGDGVICVLGYVISERVKVRPETTVLLHVLLQ